MFNEDQQRKLQVFASLTKLTNTCFDKCCNINIQDDFLNDIEIKNTNLLSIQEKECISLCSYSYIVLNQNVHNHLLKNQYELEKKNKEILDKKT